VFSKRFVLAAGPAHESPNEVVFVFDGGESSEALKLAAEDPAVWRAAKAWAECLEGRPRVAREAFSWRRGKTSE